MSVLKLLKVIMNSTKHCHLWEIHIFQNGYKKWCELCCKNVFIPRWIIICSTNSKGCWTMTTTFTSISQESWHSLKVATSSMLKPSRTHECVLVLQSILSDVRMWWTNIALNQPTWGGTLEKNKEYCGCFHSIQMTVQ